MNAYIMPDGTISLTDINFSQAKLIQTAVRRLLNIEKKLNPHDSRDNYRALSMIDDVCNQRGKQLLSIKLKS